MIDDLIFTAAARLHRVCALGHKKLADAIAGGDWPLVSVLFRSSKPCSGGLACASP